MILKNYALTLFQKSYEIRYYKKIWFSVLRSITFINIDFRNPKNLNSVIKVFPLLFYKKEEIKSYYIINNIHQLQWYNINQYICCNTNILIRISNSLENMHQWRVVKQCFKSWSNFRDCKLKLPSLPTKFSSNLNDWTPRYNLSNYIGYSFTLYYLLLAYMYLFLLWYNLSTKFTAKSSGKVLYL